MRVTAGSGQLVLGDPVFSLDEVLQGSLGALRPRVLGVNSCV
jgi:hypothetical protein